MESRVLLDYEFVVSSNEYLVRALIKLAGRAAANADRIPLNLSIVLDRSGSMSGAQLAAARDAAGPSRAAAASGRRRQRGHVRPRGVGITAPDQLVGLCRTAREQGITTTTIGFGARGMEDRTPTQPR